MAADKPSKPERASIAVNKKARLKYEVLETFDAGLVLKGTEVKTLRKGKVSIDESFARMFGSELFLVGAHIDEYSHGNQMNHEPLRKRKLLLKRSEIARIAAKAAQKGLTLVPLAMWFSERGWAKVTIGLCRGKKLHDKRETIAKKEAKREIRRAL